MKKSIWIGALFIVLLAGSMAYYFFQNNSSDTEVLKLEYEKPNAAAQFSEEYDVIVIGGEPEGVAAAVSAARNGAKTLLVEKREELGGLFTYGMLNFLDIPQGEDGKSVSQGIFAEWHELVGEGNAFGIVEAKAVFKKLIEEEANITLTTKTEVVDPILDENKVIGVKFKNENGEFTVSGKTFIDATQDADFAALSNVPYFIGGEDIGIKDTKMAVTLMIHLKNVDWDGVKETAKSEKFGPAEVTDTVAWGFSNLHDAYKPVEENTRLRGLNLVKNDDEYFINALQIFGINGLDESSKQEAIEKGGIETKHILQFLQKEFPGFENAEIASIPTELYVRETRHIWAEYQLSMSDVWTNRDYWDSIGFGAYPVDVQAQTPQDSGFVLSSPKQYAIPFRSIVPKEVDGLLVVGRSAGFSSLAAGSARVVPTGMVTGEAAGAAAALSIEEQVSFREMSKSEELIQRLREKLEQQGSYVIHIKTDYPYKDEWYDGSIQTLINYGLVVGGYKNELNVNNVGSKHQFINMLMGGVRRSSPSFSEENSQKIDEIYTRVFSSENGPLKKEEAVSIVNELVFQEMDKDSWQILMNKGLINEEMAYNFSEANEDMKVKEIFAIVASVIDYLNEK